VSNNSTAIILAGGRSTRLGRDKASEPLLGVPLLRRVIDSLAGLVDELVVVGRRDQDLEWARTSKVRIVSEVYPDSGPAGGLYTGLESIAAPVALAVACDMPLLQPPLMAALLALVRGHQAVVPVSDGQLQPLCAVYRKSCLDRIQAEIEAGNLKLVSIVERLDAHYVERDVWRKYDPDGLSFSNLNSEADLRRAESILRVNRAPAS
jgi:molybdopterin-guanine dinucleotide biosynthesis protein A